MDAMIAAGARGYVTAAAVNLVMSAREDPTTRAAVLGATLAVPDGQPLVWALRALGHAARHARLRARPDGPLLRARRAHGHADLPLRRARRRRRSSCSSGACASASPGCAIAGGYSPPFRALTPPRRSGVIARRSTPRAPRSCGSAPASPSRSSGCARMRPRLRAPLLVGVGAAFDFHAGLVPQAPALDAAQRPGVDLPARRASRAGCGGATPATTPASWPASRASTLRHRRAGAEPRGRAPLSARLSAANLWLDDHLAEHRRRRRRRPRPRRPAAGAVASPTAACSVDRHRQRPRAPGRRARGPDAVRRRPAPRSCSTRVHASGRLTLSDRVADAAARAPHRDHARHAVVLAHRDRHARHPLGARRPARRARARALADPALDGRARARPTSSPATCAKHRGFQIGEERVRRARPRADRRRALPGGDRHAAVHHRRRRRALRRGRRGAVRRRSARRSCRPRPCRPSSRRSGRTSCATRTSRCRTC